jgi:WD40 repeat protein
VFTGSRDKSIRIWRIGSFDEYGQRGQTVLIKNIPDAHTGSVLCLSVDIDLAGKGQMISGSSDHTTRLWSVDLSDPSSPQISLESTLRGHDLAVLDVALTPEYIITASKDTTVRVYSRPTLELKHVWEDHERAVNAIAVSPDGRSVVSASGSGMWIVRDLDSGEMVRKGGGKQGQLGGVACIAWKVSSIYIPRG